MPHYLPYSTLKDLDVRLVVYYHHTKCLENFAQNDINMEASRGSKVDILPFLLVYSSCKAEASRAICGCENEMWALVVFFNFPKKFIQNFCVTNQN